MQPQTTGEPDESKPTTGLRNHLSGQLRPHITAILLVVAGALVVIVGLLANEAKDRVDEWLNPTEAIVTGAVNRERDPLVGAVVALLKTHRSGDPIQSTTDNAGEFIFNKVENDVYTLEIYDQERRLYAKHFVVPDDGKEIKLPLIVIGIELSEPTDPVVDGTPFAPPLPTPEVPIDLTPEQTPGIEVPIPTPTEMADAATPEAGLPGASPETSLPDPVKLEYRVETAGEEQECSEEGCRRLWHVVVSTFSIDPDVVIESVTYELHPSFQPSVLTVFGPNDFVVEFNTWGEFDLVALVQLDDGTELQLTQPIVWTSLDAESA